MGLIEINWPYYSRVHDKFKRDVQFNVEAIDINSRVLILISAELKNSQPFIEQIVKRSYIYFREASDELKSNIDFITKMIYIDYKILCFVTSQSIIDNEEFFKVNIRASPLLIEFGTVRLRNKLEEYYNNYINSNFGVLTLETMLGNVGVTLQEYRTANRVRLGY